MFHDSWFSALYLNLLQARRGLTEILRSVKALGRVDLGVDQPLLELSEGWTKALLKQLLFALALPGCLETQTRDKSGKQNQQFNQFVYPQISVSCFVSDLFVWPLRRHFSLCMCMFCCTKLYHIVKVFLKCFLLYICKWKGPKNKNTVNYFLKQTIHCSVWEMVKHVRIREFDFVPHLL